MTVARTIATLTKRLAPALVAAVALSPARLPAGTVQGPIMMVPHRAVYDMVLDTTRASSNVTGVDGRMVFEITGSACEGYTQNMRFVTRTESSESDPTISDLRSTTFENAAATQFRFTGSQLRDQKPSDSAAGNADRPSRSAALEVHLAEPEKKSLTFAGAVYLPVQHSIALVEAGRAGKTRLKADLYDGSELGDKVYETISDIGPMVPPGGNKSLPVIKNSERLDALPAWPVTISYYEKASAGQDAAPAYQLGFLFYDNGVSRKLVIDYGDFAIKGDLKEITFLDPSPGAETCAAAVK